MNRIHWDAVATHHERVILREKSPKYPPILPTSFYLLNPRILNLSLSLITNLLFYHLLLLCGLSRRHMSLFLPRILIFFQIISTLTSIVNLQPSLLRRRLSKHHISKNRPKKSILPSTKTLKANGTRLTVGVPPGLRPSVCFSRCHRFCAAILVGTPISRATRSQSMDLISVWEISAKRSL